MDCLLEVVDCRWEVVGCKWEGDCRWGLQEGDCEREVGGWTQKLWDVVGGRRLEKGVNVHFQLTNSCLKFKHFVSCICHFCIIK